MGAISANPILVTRPDEPGRLLAAALNALGAQALWIPAFDLAEAPDAGAVRTTLARLESFDLAVFVSPAAVRATADLWNAGWPPHTAIAAVGRATAAAVRTHLHPPADAAVVAPDDDHEGGSEALLRVLDAQRTGFPRVLILRAAGGREWLGDELALRGAQVETLAVYDRRAHALNADELARIAALDTSPAAAIDSVFSSSEAVETMRRTLTGHLQTWNAMQRGAAAASHPRIADRLRSAGFARIAIARLRAEEILAALGRAGAQ